MIDEYLQDIQRRRAKTVSQKDKITSCLSNYLSDICRNSNNGEEKLTLTSPRRREEKYSVFLSKQNLENAPCKLAYKKSNRHKFLKKDLKVSKILKSSVQKSITSYGKIKKDNTRELIKRGSVLESPRLKLTVCFIFVSYGFEKL